MATTINASDLTTENKLNTITPTPDSILQDGQGIITGAINSIDANQKTVDDAQKVTNANLEKIAKDQQVLTEKSADTATALDTSGYNTEKANLDTYNSELNTIGANISGLANEAKAIPLLTQERNANTGATDAGIAPQNAGALRQNAIKALTQSSLADILTAKINNSSIRLNSAKDKAQQIIDLKYAPVEQEIANLKEQLALNEQYITEPAERKLLNNQKIVLDERTRILNDVKDKSNKAIDAIQQMIKDGNVNPQFGAQQIQKIIGGGKLSEVYKDIGITGADNPAIVNGYDISSYATDPNHEIAVNSIYKSIGADLSDAKSIQEAIDARGKKSPITGAMVYNSAQKYGVDPKLMLSIMIQDSNLGTAGLGVKTKNAGNVGNDDEGNTVTYKKWDDGVDAVAKWLSKHKSTNVYSGQFGATIDQATDFEPATVQKEYRQKLQNLVASGDYKSAYTKMQNSVSKSLTGDNKTQFDSKVSSLPAIEGLKSTLQAYADAGGQTGLLKGTLEDIYAKLGEVKDPKYKTLATDLKIALQRYRKDLSGAAFSEQEAKDYASVNPSGKNKLDLNMALLDGMYTNFKRSVDSTVDAKVGDGAGYIRQYATYQGLKPDDVVIKFTTENPSYKSAIDEMVNNNISANVIMKAIGFENLLDPKKAI